MKTYIEKIQNAQTKWLSKDKNRVLKPKFSRDMMVELPKLEKLGIIITEEHLFAMMNEQKKGTIESYIFSRTKPLLKAAVKRAETLYPQELHDCRIVDIDINITRRMQIIADIDRLICNFIPITDDVIANVVKSPYYCNRKIMKEY